MKKIIGTICMAAMTGAFAQEMPVIKLSELTEKTEMKNPWMTEIDMKNLLTVPVGQALLTPYEMAGAERGGLVHLAVPRECSEGAKCAALRVSHLLIDDDTKVIRGALGSNVYPTVAEGAYAITNEIFSTVWKLTDGKAMAIPLQIYHKKGTCEMTFFWKPDPGKKEERELYVWGFVTSKRQMGVGCLLHTRGDGLKTGLVTPEKETRGQSTANPASQK